MEQYEAALEFENYVVTKATYELNSNFEPDKSNGVFDVDFDLKSEIDFTDDEKSVVYLNAKVGDELNSNCPFLIEVVISGNFIYRGDSKNKEDFLTSNAIAILFPYVRSIVSEMSIKSNIFPQYKLPLINVVKYLTDENRIEIIR